MNRYLASVTTISVVANFFLYWEWLDRKDPAKNFLAGYKGSAVVITDFPASEIQGTPHDKAQEFWKKNDGPLIPLPWSIAKRLIWPGRFYQDGNLNPDICSLLGLTEEEVEAIELEAQIAIIALQENDHEHAFVDQDSSGNTFLHVKRNPEEDSMIINGFLGSVKDLVHPDRAAYVEEVLRKDSDFRTKRLDLAIYRVRVDGQERYMVFTLDDTDQPRFKIDGKRLGGRYEHLARFNDWEKSVTVISREALMNAPNFTPP